MICFGLFFVYFLNNNADIYYLSNMSTLNQNVIHFETFYSFESFEKDPKHRWASQERGQVLKCPKEIMSDLNRFLWLLSLSWLLQNQDQRKDIDKIIELSRRMSTIKKGGYLCTKRIMIFYLLVALVFLIWFLAMVFAIITTTTKMIYFLQSTKCIVFQS